MGAGVQSSSVKRSPSRCTGNFSRQASSGARSSSTVMTAGTPPASASGRPRKSIAALSPAWGTPCPSSPTRFTPDDIGLILDGARAQQLPPGVRPRRGPVGDVEQQLVVELGPPAAEHGESQVIADQRTDAQPPPWDAPGRAPGREVLVLPAHAEQVPLVVMAGEAPGSHPPPAGC